MTDYHAMPAGKRLNRKLVGSALLSLLYIALLFSYARIHGATLSELWPLNLREPANIINTEALLDPTAPPMYYWDSLPEQTNLYGPLYPLAAAPLTYLLCDTPYLAHRLTNALLLILSCGIIGFLISAKAGRPMGAVGAILFYVATVASPSIAAGPDLLAVFFYIIAIGAIHHFGFNWKSIFFCTVFAFCGLLTKPYTILVIPGMLTYGYLFISPKRALLAATAIATACVLGYFILSNVLPAYSHCVFGIHGHYATRHLETLLGQTWEFTYLHFAVLALFALSFPYRSLFKSNTLSLARFYGDQPLLVRPIGFDRFMTVAAGAALLLFLGWHGGAYLIYFNHLLLPPLLLAGLSNSGLLTKRPYLSQALLGANALLILYLMPPMPKGETYPDFITPLANETEPLLITPALEPLRRILPTARLTDNSQAEYLVNFDLQNESPSHAKTSAWLEKESAKIEAKTYKYLLLSNMYDHPHLFVQGKPMTPLTSNYEVVGFFNIHVYHAPFRERNRFGKQPIPIFIFKRIEASTTPRTSSN